MGPKTPKKCTQLQMQPNLYGGPAQSSAVNAPDTTNLLSNSSNKTRLSTTDHVTIDGFLATLQLRHLEAVVLKMDQQAVAARHNESNISELDSVYFELCQALPDTDCPSPINRLFFRSVPIRVIPSPSWESTVIWDSAFQPDFGLALRGSTISCTFRRLRRFSLAFYRSHSPNELLLHLPSVDLARDICQLPLSPATHDLLEQSDNADVSTLLASNIGTSHVALRLKGVYFVVRPSQPGVELELATSRFDSPSYCMLTLRQLLATSMKSIDLEIAAAQVRREVAIAEARLECRRRVVELRPVVALKRRLLDSQLTRLAECRSRLAVLRADCLSWNHCLAVLQVLVQATRCRLRDNASPELEASRRQLLLARTQLDGARRDCITRLCEIFPVGPAGEDTLAGVLLLPAKRQEGRRIPRLSKGAGAAAAATAAAYGMAAQLVALAAAVLDCPLRHPVILRGSKSYISDQLIRDFQKSDFPLYRSSRDKVYFARGAFLLNLNIYGVACCILGAPVLTNLRDTAGNLRRLLASIMTPAGEAVAGDACRSVDVKCSSLKISSIDMLKVDVPCRSVDHLEERQSGEIEGSADEDSLVSSIARSA